MPLFWYYGQPTIDVDVILSPFRSPPLKGFGDMLWLTQDFHYGVQLGKNFSSREIPDGSSCIAKSDPKITRGTYDVVFTRDEMKRPLDEIVYLSIEFALRNKYKSMAMQLFRDGVYKEQSKEHERQNAASMILAIKRIHFSLPNIPIYVALNSLQREAIAVFTQEAPCLGSWNDKERKFIT